MPKSLAVVMTCGETAGTHVWRFLVEQYKLALADLKNVPRYIIRVAAGLAVLCGLLNLWGAYGDGTMPAIVPLSKLSGLDPYCISSPKCIDRKATPEKRWQGLAPALAILDQVDPTVARWVREKYASGKLAFSQRYLSADAFARYDAYSGRLTIYRIIFCESDGVIAATLCHEYRHSRQNAAKSAQYVLSFLFKHGGDDSIIENDAMLYEQQARVAIFGDGHSRQRELAAWARSVAEHN